ncbi:MAG: outer membrane protein OmpA-like peptidoglycan-associated protein [Akkermansiaceae bacterium]|jgi:outer membrane protein OmpA-like peptidoglycan-associated protein
MAVENEDHQTQSNVTPASNQNLIIGIVMGAVVLLLLLLVISRQMHKNEESKESKELTQIKQEINERKARSEALHYADIAGVTQNPDALISQIKSDTEALGRLVNASASDAAMLRTAQDRASAMSRRNTDLENQLRQDQAAASRVAGLEAELARARQSLAGAVDKGSADSLRDQLALAKNERDRLQNELAQLRTSQGGMVDLNTHALVQAENTQLNTDNTALRFENQRLRAELAGAKLFVTNSKDVSPRALALYQELKRIEPENHRARAQIYTRIDSDLKASVREDIVFKKGSADIALEHETHIKEMATAAPVNSFFLVVGYASPSGDSMSNKELSSQRATRVASMVNSLKKKGQGVQAVYLGEGNRFGPDDAPNQVCEVWEIRP